VGSGSSLRRAPVVSFALLLGSAKKQSPQNFFQFFRGGAQKSFSIKELNFAGFGRRPRRSRFATLRGQAGGEPLGWGYREPRTRATLGAG